jgi:hypothetical protein
MVFESMGKVEGVKLLLLLLVLTATLVIKRNKE